MEFDELWRFLATGECSDIVFRTQSNTKFSIAVIGRNLYVYCFDEFGKYERCKFNKLNFLTLADAVHKQGNLVSLPIYSNLLEDTFAKDEIVFLLPVVLYMMQYVLSKSTEYDILPDKEAEELEEFEELVCEEDVISNHDLSELSVCKTIYFHPRMEAFYKKASAATKRIIDGVAQKFATSDPEELLKYLQTKTNKKLKGASNNIYKIYVDNFSTGHRLLWIKGSDIDPVRYNNSIIFLAYEEDHDAQGRTGRNINLSADFSYETVGKILNRLKKEASNGFNNIVPPYKYVNGVIIPQLSDLQKSACLITPPAIIFGSAGSGKTHVSINIFKNLFADGITAMYLTFSRELAKDVASKLNHYGINKDVLKNNVLTASDFFIIKSGLDMKNVELFDFEKFKGWKAHRYIHKSVGHLAELDPWIAWTYIRGVIKGLNPYKEPLTKKAFINWVAKNEPSVMDAADSIYQIFLDYQKFCKESKHTVLDDNDLASLILKANINPCLECSIVDEAQDLTYTQLEAIRKLTLGNQLYLCGDNNQKINPTIIDLTATGQLFSENFKDVNAVPLGNSFRSCHGVIKFVNHLSRLRKAHIAHQDFRSDVAESTARDNDEGLWVTKCNPLTISLEDICSLGKGYSNCIIIVPDDCLKNQLEQQYDFMSGRVKTVFEIKGLEYDNVIIINFLKNNYQIFDRILNNKLKRSTFGRLQFNKLYVAATRAKERLIIWDDVPLDDPISENLYQNVVVKNDIKEILRYINLDDDDEGWVNEGRRLEGVNDFLSAKHAYMRSKSVDTTKDVQRCNAMLDYFQGLSQVGSEMLITCNRAAKDLFDIEEFALAEEIYDEIARLFGRQELGIDYLRSKIMQNKQISDDDMLTYIAGDNFKVEFEEWGHCLQPFFDATIKSNNEIIEKLKIRGC